MCQTQNATIMIFFYEVESILIMNLQILPRQICSMVFKRTKKGLVGGAPSQDIGKDMGNSYCQVKKWLVDWFLPQNGITKKITAVAVCAIK